MNARLRSVIVNPFTVNVKNRLERFAQHIAGKSIAESVKNVKELQTIDIKDVTYKTGSFTSLRPPERVTTKIDANEQLLYFTSPCLTRAEESLVFISDRTGHPNIFIRNLQSKKEDQISDNADGILKSYVYFDGTPYRGLSKASPCLHSASGTIYYIQGRIIFKASSEGQRQALAELPDGQMTGYTHISGDGKLLCIPTVDERALDGKKQLSGRPRFNIDERVRREGLNSYLRIYDTESGKEIANEIIPKAWVTHVQFSPVNNNLILYNNEWASQSGIRRMWLYDGKQHVQLRNESENRNANDWVCHEIWSQDGSAIVYHGKDTSGRHFIGKVTPHNGEIIELPLFRRWKQYGHYHLIEPGTLITDGHFRAPHPKLTFNCPWLCRVNVDWKNHKMTWTPLTAHLSSWTSQDTHPHPIIDSASKYVYFTSDRDGSLAIYRISL
jgi:oligogalacturonide lyase